MICIDLALKNVIYLSFDIFGFFLKNVILEKNILFWDLIHSIKCNFYKYLINVIWALINNYVFYSSKKLYVADIFIILIGLNKKCYFRTLYKRYRT